MKLELNIDASSLSESGCILRWKNVVIDGFREKISGASLVYGSAFHKFQETMIRTHGDVHKAKVAMSEVFNRPKQQSKTSWLLDERHLFSTCYTYWEDVVLKDSQFDLLLLPNDEPAVEQTFSFRYYEDDHIIVNLCGTIDRIGKVKNGCYVIRDYKTTSKYNVREYLNEYRMSKQLRFYRLALRIMAQRYPESVLGQIGATNVGARIDGVFLKARPTDNVYESSDVFLFSDESINEFESLLQVYIGKLSEAVAKNHFPREGIINGSCQSQYKCKFWNVCQAPAEIRPVMLERDFNKVVYNPLKFGEVL